MANTKKVTVSMTEETEKIAQEDSIEILGSKNVSGYISYLIKKARKETHKKKNELLSLDNYEDLHFCSKEHFVEFFFRTND